MSVSRREFLKTCAVMSSVPMVGLAPGVAAAQAPKKGGTLRVGFYIEAATMDPHLSGSKVDRQVYHNIYEPLVTLDAKLGIKPGLAESWSQPDARTLVFKLRRGVKFHDGSDFTAEAAKFNFDRMKTEPKSVRKGEVANIDGVDVVDASTIRINLKKPDAALLATLTDRAGMMVSPRVVQERGVELGRNAKGAGTGPFEFVEWVKDDHLLIKRNEGYWNKQGGPYLDRVRYRPIPDDTVKLQSLQSGEIDVMDYVQLREVGITLKIKLVDAATQLSDGNSRNFEMISYQWSGRPDPDGNIYQFFKTTPGTSLNWSGISNPQLDALLDRSREVSGQAERKKIFGEITKILQDELPMIYIVHPIEPKAFSPRVQGYDPIPDGMMRFKDVWLK